MLRQVAQKNMQDQFAYENYRQQQRMFGEAATQFIHQKKAEITEKQKLDRITDKQMIDMDNIRAKQLHDHQQ